MGSVKVRLAVIILAYMLFVAMVPYGASGSAFEARYQLSSGDASYGMDLNIMGLIQTLFHQQMLSGTGEESLGISFPGSLPFGPGGVSLCLPSISQTRKQTISASSVGFFQMNAPFFTFINYGANPVGVGQFGRPGPVAPAGITGNALLYPEMVNRGNLAPGLKFTESNINNTRLTLPPQQASEAYREVQAINDTIEACRNISVPQISSDQEYIYNNSSPTNKTSTAESDPEARARNNTAAICRNTSIPALLSGQKFNLDSNASEISNMSIVERMWRNAHYAHFMDDNYEGGSSMPVWIAPQGRIADILIWVDQEESIGRAYNETMPGADITPLFWDLNPLAPGTPASPNQVPTVPGGRETPKNLSSKRVSRVPGAAPESHGPSNQSLLSYFIGPPG